MGGAAASGSIGPRDGGAGAAVGLSEPALERVLRNLLSNAAAAGAVRTLVQARADGADTVLAVHDDGPGFPPEFVAHAFERFSRADAARGRTGAGLGLALVLGLAEDAGGTATVANGGLLGGAVVTVRVPR